MLYFVLGSLISADALVNIDACDRALNCLKGLKRDFETSKLKDDPKLKSYWDNAESIIEKTLTDWVKVRD